MDPAFELPHDVESLKALIRARDREILSREEELRAREAELSNHRTELTRQQTELAKHQTEIARHQAEIRRLEHDNKMLFALAFGKSSERRRPLSEEEISQQITLFLQEIASEASRLAKEHRVIATVEIPRKVPAKKGRRSTFPDHLPVIRTVCELEDEDRNCGCGGRLEEFSEETSRELERIETTVVHETVRKKYSCRDCGQNVKTAPWRGKVIEKGLLGPGFLAYLITERFSHHMPYYRLEGKFKSEGLDLSRSVLCEAMTRCGELLEPIADQIRKEVLESPVIHTDDTPVVIAHSTNGGSRKGRSWIYLGHGKRHWYDFTETRKRDGPARVLADFKGFVQADAYAGYDQLYLPGGAIEVGCWAHARRGFVEAESSDPSVAKEAIDRIRQLFLIEEQARELSPEARLELRQLKSAPLVEEFHAWMDLAETQVLPRSPAAKAIGYVRNQWRALTRYLDDGRLEISNNAAENALRPFAVGRKNWLFFQRNTGGKTASIIMSLLMTAKAIGIDPRQYFRDVLLRIATCSDVKSLTPHGWKDRWEPEVKATRDEVLKKMMGTA